MELRREFGSMLPRIIRLKDAPQYLGLDKKRFNTMVRPYITEIRYGSQSVGFDRVDLDTWADECKSANGRPGKQKGEDNPWRKEREYQVSSREARYGTSTKWSGEEDFAKAVARVTKQKRRDS